MVSSHLEKPDHVAKFISVRCLHCREHRVPPANSTKVANSVLEQEPKESPFHFPPHFGKALCDSSQILARKEFHKPAKEQLSLSSKL